MRILKVTLLCMVFFGALVSASRVIGATQPSPVAPLFTNADGTPCKMPCLFGITTDDVVAEVIQAKFDAHPLTRGLFFVDTSRQNRRSRDSYVYVGTDTNGHRMDVSISIQNDGSFLIIISTEHKYTDEAFDAEMYTTSPLTALILESNSGDFISYLGSPSQIHFGGFDDTYFVSYSDHQLLIDFSIPSDLTALSIGRILPRVKIQQPLYTFYFMTDSETYKRFTHTHYSWKGFTEYDPK